MRLRNELLFFIAFIIIFGVSNDLSPLYYVLENNSYTGFRGVNLGNFLEAPNEGDWNNGLLIEEKHFQMIELAGFDLVRIPIRWNAHAMNTTPYTINDSFFDRIDWVINQGLTRNLSLIINIHHYDELMVDPEGHKERFLSLWQQIAQHYQNYSNELIFEVLNEPHNKLNTTLWNQYLQEAIDIIRITNPDRTLIVGPSNYNNIWLLNDLILPQDDSNIVVTFHFYSPFELTHQGAEWVDGSDAWLGTNWTGSLSERYAINYEFDTAIGWAQTNNKQLFLGEFGAYQTASMDDRIEWTTYVREKAELYPEMWGWSYWEFCYSFGIINSSLNEWYEGLLGSLLPDSPVIVTTTTYSPSTTTSLLSVTGTSTEAETSIMTQEISSTTQSNIPVVSSNLEILPIILLIFCTTAYYNKKRSKNEKK